MAKGMASTSIQTYFFTDTAPCCTCVLHKNSLRKFLQSMFTYLLKAQLMIWELTPVFFKFLSVGMGVTCTTTAVVMYGIFITHWLISKMSVKLFIVL